MFRRQRLSHVIMLMWIGVLLVCNQHLLVPGRSSELIFSIDKVMQGEWWRVFTHPLVHVSWYHLIMDAVATTILWLQWKGVSCASKITGLLCCWLGSLLVATACSPLISQVGYCGLSGLAHGLMLLMVRDWLEQGIVQRRHAGAAVTLLAVSLSSLAVLIGKVGYEMYTGHVLFASLHPGNISIPIVESHFGGVFGAAVFWLGDVILQLRRKQVHVFQTAWQKQG
ncbi:rhomboid family intramembrane serine protease [Desulfogranum japonicum]|uniref:rhomboid family intramembrane serine protease n=1 Tax=Desulfogranum japonicum TaxID=231447 RepID=UPI000402D906|nr:rhomboid family intramembrane serine protease [Desulfogranum japonicum]